MKPFEPDEIERFLLRTQGHIDGVLPHHDGGALRGIDGDEDGKDHSKEVKAVVVRPLFQVRSSCAR